MAEKRNTENFTESLAELLRNCNGDNPHEEIGGIKDASATRKLNVNIRKLNEHATIPTYAHSTDAGFDLYAIMDTVIDPGETAVILTGLAVGVPEGYALDIRPRSGITAKTKLRVQYGTVDSGYSGEIGVIVDNISTDDWSNASRRVDNSYDENTRNKSRGYIVRRGDRIAQAILAPIVQASFTEVDSLDDSERGANGYGSSGVSSADD